MKKYIKATPPCITQAGLILEVIHDTPSTNVCTVVDVFFPVHYGCYGVYQVSPDQQEFFRNLLVGKPRGFWKSEPRKNHEIGGDYLVVDWGYTPGTPVIAEIIEIKRPVNLAYVLMSDGSYRFVSKTLLPSHLVQAYRAEISGESKDGQA